MLLDISRKIDRLLAHHASANNRPPPPQGPVVCFYICLVHRFAMQCLSSPLFASQGVKRGRDYFAHGLVVGKVAAKEATAG